MTQTKKGKEINIFKSLARSGQRYLAQNTKNMHLSITLYEESSQYLEEEQEVNLVWPNLCIF